MSPRFRYNMLNSITIEPVSRTYQYRKMMKPMLERKRRARINRCLDELKELMTGTLLSDGENVAKLEKADILELTVKHLQHLKEHNTVFFQSPATELAARNERFWSGFRHCASEISYFLQTIEQHSNLGLTKHVSSFIKKIETIQSTKYKNQNILPSPNTVAVNSSQLYRIPTILSSHKNNIFEKKKRLNFMNPVNNLKTLCDSESNKNDLIPQVLDVEQNAQSNVWRPW